MSGHARISPTFNGTDNDNSLASVGVGTSLGVCRGLLDVDRFLTHEPENGRGRLCHRDGAVSEGRPGFRCVHVFESL